MRPNMIPISNSIHMGMASSVWEIMSGGVSNIPNTKQRTKMIKMIKEKKMKVQAQVQGDEVRVTGKKRDELQTVMALVREADLGQPFQFKNFRD